MASSIVYNDNQTYQLVMQICDNLGKYYQSLNQPCDALFWKYCENEEYLDKDAFNDEFEEDAANCMLLLFHKDENDQSTFPFKDKYEAKDEEWRQQYIYDLIKKCSETKDIMFINGEVTEHQSIMRQNSVKSISMRHLQLDDMDKYSPQQIHNLVAFAYIHQIENSYTLQVLDIIWIMVQYITEFDEEFYNYLKDEPKVNKICNNFKIHYNRLNKSYNPFDNKISPI